MSSPANTYNLFSPMGPEGALEQVYLHHPVLKPDEIMAVAMLVRTHPEAVRNFEIDNKQRADMPFLFGEPFDLGPLKIALAKLEKHD